MLLVKFENLGVGVVIPTPCSVHVHNTEMLKIVNSLILQNNELRNA